MKATKEKTEERAGFEKNENGPRPDEKTNQEEAENVFGRKEGTSNNAVALSNHRFDPFSPIIIIPPMVIDLFKVRTDPLVDSVLVSFCCCSPIKVQKCLTIMLTFMLTLLTFMPEEYQYCANKNETDERFYDVWGSARVCWDEAHFGKFAGWWDFISYFIKVFEMVGNQFSISSFILIGQFSIFSQS